MLNLQVNLCCRCFVFCSFLCFVNNCNAQFFIEGRLTDTSDNSIPSAMVTLLNKNSGLVIKFGITDKYGKFSLEVDKASKESFWLYFTATGFRRDSMPLTNHLSNITVRLKRAVIVLPPVVVKNRRSFRTIKPDTSNYKIEKFAQQQDRTIEDVLKKIPGIEIDGAGKISFNGRSISNFYIDGDDLIGDRYTIASKAIRHDMVENVQIIENHNPIKVLESVTINNNTAINLQLNESARLKLMGNADLSAGTHETYNVLGNLLSLKRKKKFINQFKANNSGLNILNNFTPHNGEDLIKRQELNFSKPFLNIGGIGTRDFGQQRYLFNHSLFATANCSFIPKPETQIRFNAYYFNDRNSVIGNSTTVYSLPNETFVYEEEKRLMNRNNGLIADFSISTNKRNYYFKHVVSTSLGTPSSIAITRLNGVKIFQNYGNSNWNISDQLSLIRKAKRNGAITELNSYINHQSLPEILDIIPGLNDSIFNNGIKYLQLNQGIKLRNIFSHQSFSHKIVSEFLVQTYKAGIVFQWQHLESRLSMMDTLHAIKLLADSFQNNLNWNQIKGYFRADYDFINGANRISISVPLYQYFISKQFNQEKYSENFKRITFTPSIRWRSDLNSENTVNAFYQFNLAPSAIQENYFNYILSRFNSLKAWRVPIVLNSVHVASLGWTKRNSTKLFTLYSNIEFNSGDIEYLSAINYYNTMQVQKGLPGNTRSKNRSLNLGASKYIFPFHTTISGKYSIQHIGYEQVQQKKVLQFSDFVQSVTTNIQSKITTWINGTYNLLFSKEIGKTQSDGISINQRSSLIVNQVVFNIFPLKQLAIMLSYENYLSKRNNIQMANSSFLDGQLLYKFKKGKSELTIDAFNITGKDIYTTVTTIGNQSTQSRFPLRPTTVMFSMRVYF